MRTKTSYSPQPKKAMYGFMSELSIAQHGSEDSASFLPSKRIEVSMGFARREPPIVSRNNEGVALLASKSHLEAAETFQRGMDEMKEKLTSPSCHHPCFAPRQYVVSVPIDFTSFSARRQRHGAVQRDTTEGFFTRPFMMNDPGSAVSVKTIVGLSAILMFNTGLAHHYEAMSRGRSQNLSVALEFYIKTLGLVAEYEQKYEAAHELQTVSLAACINIAHVHETLNNVFELRHAIDLFRKILEEVDFARLTEEESIVFSTMSWAYETMSVRPARAA